MATIPQHRLHNTNNAVGEPKVMNEANAAEVTQQQYPDEAAVEHVAEPWQHFSRVPQSQRRQKKPTLLITVKSYST